MAAPAWPTLNEGAWNLVASNVTSGTIDRLKSKYKYYSTYVLTGAGAPLAAVKDNSPVIFQDSNQEEISANAAIDVYLWLEDATDSGDTNITNAVQVNI